MEEAKDITLQNKILEVSINTFEYITGKQVWTNTPPKDKLLR